MTGNEINQARLTAAMGASGDEFRQISFAIQYLGGSGTDARYRFVRVFAQRQSVTRS